MLTLPRYMLDNIVAGMHPDRMTILEDEEQPDGTHRLRMVRSKDGVELAGVYTPGATDDVDLTEDGI